MTSPLMFARDGRCLPYFPVTTDAIKAIAEHIDKRRPYAIATYVVLLEIANEERSDRAATSHAELVRRTGASRSTIQRALADLQVAGVLQITERIHAGLRAENEYVVIEPGQASPESSAASEGPNAVASVSANAASEGPNALRPTDASTSRIETEEEGAGNARARSEKVSLPKDLPDELLPSLRGAYRVLREFAVEKGAKEVDPVALARVFIANPGYHYVAEAHEYCGHWEGQAPRDVVAGYRRWLKRATRMAGLERLDDRGRPVVQPGTLPAGVTPLRRRVAAPTTHTRPREPYPDEVTRS